MRTLKIRIYPNKRQQEEIEKTFGCCRFVYNWALERRIQYYQETQKTIHKYDLINEMVQMKKVEGFSWLREANSQSLQCSIFRLDTAFISFFKKIGDFPKFKSKRRCVQSFDVPQKFHFCPISKTIKIPKIGAMRFRDKLNFRQFGEVKMVRIKREFGQYFACVVCVLTPTPLSDPVKFENAVGIDLGIKTFATLSNGQKIKLPNLSSNKRKAARQRKDFLHKLSTKLVDNQDWQTIVVEDIKASRMVSKIKNINRAIFSQGWRMFIEMLRYKCEERGKNFIIISTFEAASRTCTCGKKKSDLKVTHRKWICVCGLTHDRDILAAQNIRKFGTGDSTVSAGAQRECISKLSL